MTDVANGNGTGNGLRGTRKLISVVCSLATVLGILALAGFYGLSDTVVGEAIAAAAALGGAHLLGQSFVDSRIAPPPAGGGTPTG